MTVSQEKEKGWEGSKSLILEGWDELKKVPVHDLLDKGYKPRVKTDKEGRQYITLRKGNRERGLGPYIEDRWFLLMDMLPKKFPVPKFPSSPRSTGILSSKLEKPKPIPTRIGVSMEALQYYRWCQQNGYDGDLSEWLDEIIHNYFVLEKGIQVAVVIERSEKIIDKS